MKKNSAAVNKMIKKFDKELRNALLTDLKVTRVAANALVKNLKQLGDEQLMIA
jgi:hypothetical protein